MNKYLFIFFLTLFLSILYGCDEKQQTDKKYIKIDLGDRHRVSIFDIFSKIDIMPLETNDSSLIKTIRKLIVNNDNLLTAKWNINSGEITPMKYKQRNRIIMQLDDAMQFAYIDLDNVQLCQL